MKGVIKKSAIFSADDEAHGLDDVFKRVRTRIAAEPAAHRLDFPLVYVVLTRTGIPAASSRQSSNGSAAPTSPTIRAI
jgi:hypothetical protein